MTQKVYVMVDYGGELEDSWELPVCVFTDGERAARYAERREDEMKGSPSDYAGTIVYEVDLIDEKEES